MLSQRGKKPQWSRIQNGWRRNVDPSSAAIEKETGCCWRPQKPYRAQNDSALCHFFEYRYKQRNGLLVIKSTRGTNFSNLFWEQNSTCFGQFLCPSSGVLHCKHSNGICHTGLLTAFEQAQDGTSCSQAVSKPVRHIPLLCVQWKTPDDGQRNCPKHVEFRVVLASCQ